MGNREALNRAGRRFGQTTVRGAAIATAAVRSGPDLVVIGVKRGGTTSLFRDLERHPAMCPLVPSARRLPLRENQKGVHYFDTNASRSDRWYRSHFASRPARWWRSRRAGASFTAEASPYYFFHPLAASRASAALPDAVFVVMLRDPVERTVSHWAEQTRNGVESLSLEDALAAEERRVGDAGERLESGGLATSDAHEHQSYAAQSEYAASLRRWFDAAGRDRVLVLFSEDYFAQPTATIDGILNRIDIDPIGTDVGQHRNAAPRPATLDREVEHQLTVRFRPDVDAVTALLGVTPPWPRFHAGVT